VDSNSYRLDKEDRRGCYNPGIKQDNMRMSKKNESYTFVIASKLMEHHSILELKTELSEDEWNLLVHDTSDFYAQLRAIHESQSPNNSIALEKKDMRMMRMLRRTLNSIKNFDSATINMFDINEMIKRHKEIISKELEEAKSTISVSYNNTNKADINVSRLDG